MMMMPLATDKMIVSLVDLRLTKCFSSSHEFYVVHKRRSNDSDALKLRIVQSGRDRRE